MALTIEQWYAHPSFRQELVELLRNPTLRVALEMVREKGLNSTLTPTGNTSMVEFFAIMGARKDGYHEALVNLEALSQAKSTAPPERKPWHTPTPPKPAPDGDQTSAP